MAACSVTCPRTKTACIVCLLVGCGFLATTMFLAGISTHNIRVAGLLQESFAKVGRLLHERTILWRGTDNIGGIVQQQRYNSGGLQRRLRLSRMMGSDPNQLRKAQQQHAMAMARSRGCAFNARVCNDSAYHFVGTPKCCAGSCTDVSHDLKNCGLCNRQCLLLEVCCDGECTDVNTDPNNCGKCGNVCSDACLLGVCGY